MQVQTRALLEEKYADKSKPKGKSMISKQGRSGDWQIKCTRLIQDSRNARLLNKIKMK